MLLIGNGKVLCPDKLIEDGAVYIGNGIISEIGRTAELKNKYKKAKFMDAAGGLIMPGMINAHMHFYSTFACGMNLAGKAPTNFVEILEGLWWRLDKKLESKDIYYSAMVPIIESIKCGTTTVLDHHASPFCIDGSLDIIADAVSKSGIRAALCYEVSDRDGKDIAVNGIKENTRFIEGQERDDLIKGMMGLHASFTLSDETLEAAVSEARRLNVGCHIHTAEDVFDLNDSKEKCGMGVVERLHSKGALGKKTITAHCVHISEKEMEILADTSTNVVHNPESNMNNGVGTADIVKMFKKGVLTGLGTDGMTSDMFRESKAAFIIQRGSKHDPAAGFVESYEMIMKNNAEIVSKIFSGKIGTIEIGAAGDVIILDYIEPTPLDFGNFAGHLLFGISSNSVKTTIVNGKVLMEDRELVGIDEEEICAKSKELAEKMWKRM